MLFVLLHCLNAVVSNLESSFGQIVVFRLIFGSHFFSENCGVMDLVDFKLFREPKSYEIMEVYLLTCAHVVRSILLQRRKFAARRVIQMGCRDCVPKIRCAGGFRLWYGFEQGVGLHGFAWFFCFDWIVQRGGSQFGRCLSSKSNIWWSFGSVLFNFGVIGFLLIFNHVRESEYRNLFPNCLLTCFHMARNIFWQRNHPATRRVIREVCRDYIPEIRFFTDFGGGLNSNNGLDGAVLHDILCWFIFFCAVVSNLEIFFRPIEQLGWFLGAILLQMLVPWCEAISCSEAK